MPNLLNIEELTQNKVVVPGEGPIDADIIFIGEAPAKNEVYKGRPFVGKAGEDYDMCLNFAFIMRDQVRTINLSEVRAPGDKYANFSEDEKYTWGQDLIRRINDEHINPKVLVPLGNNAMEVLSGRKGITKQRGCPSLARPEIKHDCIVLPTFHPASLGYGNNYKNWIYITLDMAKAKQIAEEFDTFELPIFHFTIEPTFAQVMDRLDWLEKEKPFVTIDIENPHLLLSAIGIAWSRYDAISIPFYWGNGSNYWTIEEEILIWKRMAEVLSQLEWGNQHVHFDRRVLQEHGIFLKDPKWDSMLLHHCLYSEMAHRLDVITSIWTNLPYYKTDETEEKGSSIRIGRERDHWEYNCLMRGSMIITNQGNIPIDKIVREKLFLKVLTLNERTDELEWKPITNWIKKENLDQQWIQIHTNKSRSTRRRGLIVTPDHKILSYTGWIEARELSTLDRICSQEPMLSKDQLSILAGTLLGDATLTKRQLVGDAYFVCTNINLDLIMYKYLWLKNIFNQPPRLLPEGKSGFPNAKPIYHITSKTMEQLSEIYDECYQDKKIAKPLLKYLDAKGLAVWYMDDGFIQKPSLTLEHPGRHAVCRISLHAFKDNEDRQAIFEFFKKRYKGGCSISNNLLNMGVAMSKAFCKEISPYIPTSMRYKLVSPFSEILCDPEVPSKYPFEPYFKKILSINSYSIIDDYSYCLTIEENHNFFTNYGLVANCYDCVGAWWAIESLIEDAREEGMLEVYEKLYIPVLTPLFKMIMNGTPVDVPRLANVQTELREMVTENIRLMSEEAKVALYVLFPEENTDQEKKLRKEDNQLNLLSWKQVDLLLYDVLNWNRYKGGSPTGKETLKKLAYREESELPTRLIQVRADRKEIGIFQEDNITDGRIKTEYNLLTDTGRLHSKKGRRKTGMNLQNVKVGEQRKFFIAEKGEVMVLVDQKQAEARIVGMYAKDENMLALFETDESIHIQNGRYIFGIDLDKDDPRYKIIKGITHGGNYGLGTTTYAHMVNIPFAEAKENLDAYHARYPGIRKNFHADVKAQLYKNRTLHNPFGRREVFLGSLDDFKTLLKAIAFKPQSTVTDINKIALTHIDKHFTVLMDTHDGLIMSVPESEVDLLVECTQEAYNTEVKIFDYKMIIPIDISVGPNWNDQTEITLN